MQLHVHGGDPLNFYRNLRLLKRAVSRHKSTWGERGREGENQHQHVRLLSMIRRRKRTMDR